MKTVMKENRVEQINDVELAAYQQNGWREIDPKTGTPLPKAGKPNSEAELRKQIADLMGDLKGFYEQNSMLASERDALKDKSKALAAELDEAHKELGTVKKELADALKALKKQEKAESK